MKKILHGVSVIALLSVAGCWKLGVTGHTEETANGTVVSGNAKFKKKTFSSLTVHGNADLDEVTVEKQLLVNGNLEAESCNFVDVKVAGNVDLEHVVLTGTLDVTGTLEVEDSKLKNVLVASDNEIEFEDSEIDALVLKKSKGKELKVELENSKVVRKVQFEGENGVVVLKGNSKVEGDVVGGKLMNG